MSADLNSDYGDYRVYNERLDTPNHQASFGKLRARLQRILCDPKTVQIRFFEPGERLGLLKIATLSEFYDGDVLLHPNLRKTGKDLNYASYGDLSLVRTMYGHAVLAHELLGHGYEWIVGNVTTKKQFNGDSDAYVRYEDETILPVENVAHALFGEPLRAEYERGAH